MSRQELAFLFRSFRERLDHRRRVRWVNSGNAQAHRQPHGRLGGRACQSRRDHVRIRRVTAGNSPTR
jgi:hypothetical protein